MNKKCGSCGKKYNELENYCTKCGLVLDKDDNLCSGNKTPLCIDKVYEQDDVFCSYCGSLTTYAMQRRGRGE